MMNMALHQLKKDMGMLKEDAQKQHNPYSFSLESEWDDEYAKLKELVADATEHIITYTEELKKKMNAVLSGNESNSNILQLFVEEFEQRGYALDKYEMKALLGMVIQLTEVVLFNQEKEDSE
jgi:Spy/CpxP family protein refolding chaperone